MSLSMKALLKQVDRGFERWDKIEDPHGLPIAEYKKEHHRIDRIIGMSMMHQATVQHYTNIADEEHF